MVDARAQGLTTRDRWVYGLVVAGIAVIYLLSASRLDMDDANNDVSGAAYGAWRIAESGEPWVDDSDGGLRTDIPERVGSSLNPDTGRAVIPRSPGVIAAAVPASWVFQRVGDGTFGPGPQLVTAALLTALAVGLLFVALRNGLDRRTSLTVTLAFALTTPVWSINGNALWTHVVTVLGIAGMAWAASAERWWLVGLFGGVALWGRLHAALIVAAVGVGVALARRRPDIVVKVGSTSAAAMALASAWSKWVYGSWVPSGGYGAGAATRVVDGSADIGAGSILENQLGMWVAPACGVLVWTPVLLVVGPGLLRRWTTVPDWARWLLVGGLLYTVVQAQIDTFTGGTGFYAYRHGLEVVTCAAPAVAHTLRGTSPRVARAAAVLLAVQLAAISLGSIFDGGFVAVDRAWEANGLIEVVADTPATAVLGLLIAVGAWCTGLLAWRSMTPDEPSRAVST